MDEKLRDLIRSRASKRNPFSVDKLVQFSTSAFATTTGGQGPAAAAAAAAAARPQAGPPQQPAVQVEDVTATVSARVEVILPAGCDTSKRAATPDC